MEFLHGGDIFDKNIIADFSVNINPLGMSDMAKREALRGIEEGNRYPDYANRVLKRAIAEEYNVHEESIICGCGADGVIFDIVRTLMPQKGLIAAPTFQEYERAMAACNTQVVNVYLKEEEFTLGEEFAKSIIRERPQLVFVCNPNNPTGIVNAAKTMKSILDACISVAAWLVVDECFLGFTDEASMVEYTDMYNRLIVLNAFTKLYAMPGLRAGYAICKNTAFIGAVNDKRQCWNLSQAAEYAAAAALKDKEYVIKTRKYITAERKRLEESLKKLGLKVYEASADYIMIYSDRDIYTECLKRGILIRDCGNYKGLKKGYYRVAVKDKETDNLLIQVLSEVLNG